MLSYAAAAVMNFHPDVLILYIYILYIKYILYIIHTHAHMTGWRVHEPISLPLHVHLSRTHLPCR